MDYVDQADMWRPARAFENGVWICAATKSGQERSIYYPGGSMIVDSAGNLRAKVAYDTHGMAVSDIDPTLAGNKRHPLGSDKFADRRPETYQVLTLPYDETAVAEVSKRPIIPGEMAFNMAAVQSHVSEAHVTSLNRVIEQDIRRIGRQAFSDKPRYSIESVDCMKGRRVHACHRTAHCWSVTIRILPDVPNPSAIRKIFWRREMTVTSLRFA
ncbi:nitrilase-related carbon-nitrogen hydrolase [Bradyrhizobium pachyrhizi]|uniref:nitrilase-related carbon-nitrogen hydrolase n=1 Tax=Bradyrhizobium pachyrhizi TaxID=280333 RepID=UPI0024B1F868|nr:nitrilase-related carbon-nitrogen hydrolase [Bradyrhizobium pachyrhizi]WFU54713.1 nitrilase-related carbon-nitrogen hydrolase [Bradyrhizobium pachyrhizi]